MRPVARISDMHACPMVDGLKPHVGGPVLSSGAPHVLAAGLPIATVGSPCLCMGPTDIIALGSSKVLAGGRPVARIGDMTAHGGLLTSGAPKVLVGG